MKKTITIVAALGLAAILTGCSSHAQIDMPVTTYKGLDAFSGKTVNYELLYSQPKPGYFKNGEKQAMQPLEKVELSVASARAMQKMTRLVESQLPSDAKMVQSDAASDMTLVVEMEARDRRGPAYSDYQAAKSFGANMLTMGMAASRYEIIADFDVNYKLIHGSRTLYEKPYKVAEVLPHKKGDFDKHAPSEFASQLLEKHMAITLGDFLKKANSSVKSTQMTAGK